METHPNPPSPPKLFSTPLAYVHKVRAGCAPVYQIDRSHRQTLLP